MKIIGFEEHYGFPLPDCSNKSAPSSTKRCSQEYRYESCEPLFVCAAL
jgi:hypothetical protein